ncbi:uncharacterized protein DS421_18g603340 [Arachis hypogaea]|nr:uncharacterized protein DS421_18g603340 [Arachis hypogaea]
MDEFNSNFTYKNTTYFFGFLLVYVETSGIRSDFISSSASVQRKEGDSIKGRSKNTLKIAPINTILCMWPCWWLAWSWWWFHLGTPLPRARNPSSSTFQFPCFSTHNLLLVFYLFFQSTTFSKTSYKDVILLKGFKHHCLPPL